MSRRRNDIEVDGPDGSIPAYISVPERPAGVAVVVLQEIFGVNAGIRATADGLADAGYAAIAPDLFWRQEKGVQLDPSSEEGRQRAMELMARLDRDQAVSDGVAALQGLRALVPGLARSVAIGYCFGGGVAYLMGARNLVDAGVSYYGTGLHTMLGELDGLQGQLLIHVAAEDHLCPPDAQNAIAAAANGGHRAEVVVHPGVGHAFARAGGPMFDKAAAARANGMTMDLLESLSRAA